jgi:hypothetical protein
VSRELAGGVVDVAARPNRLFAGGGLPFDGEVPVELRGGPSPFFVLAAWWSGRSRFPVPEIEGWRIRRLKILRRLVMLNGVMTTTESMAVGPQGP